MKLGTLKTFRNAVGATVLAFGVSGLAGNAFAYDQWVMINFADYAETNGEQMLPTNPGDIVFGDITVTAESYHEGDPVTRPYLDAYSGGLPGGLGVCQTVSAGCAGTDIEEIDKDEWVKLTFKDTNTGDILENVQIDNIMFRNQDHGTTFASDAHVIMTIADIDGNVDAGQSGSYTLVNAFPESFTGTMFTFEHNTGSYGYKDFYVEKLKLHYDNPDHPPGMPEPATLAVFGFGLAGLGVMRRRRNAR